MSSNSSSSEDEFEKIKEAVDENFLTRDLYSDDKSKNELKSQPKPPPSLRNQNHESVSINPFTIKVTPEFQSHVSKHLSRLLDELIDDSTEIFKRKKLKPSFSKSGVKLLFSSKDYLKSSDNVAPQDYSRKFVKVNLDENVYMERAKEVAVSPEWILSQEETRHWAPNTKGEVEILNLDVCGKKIFKRKNGKKK